MFLFSYFFTFHNGRVSYKPTIVSLIVWGIIALIIFGILPRPAIHGIGIVYALAVILLIGAFFRMLLEIAQTYTNRNSMRIAFPLTEIKEHFKNEICLALFFDIDGTLVYAKKDCLQDKNHNPAGPAEYSIVFLQENKKKTYPDYDNFDTELSNLCHGNFYIDIYDFPKDEERELSKTHTCHRPDYRHNARKGVQDPFNIK